MMEIWLKAHENKNLFTMQRCERFLYRAKPKASRFGRGGQSPVRPHALP